MLRYLCKESVSFIPTKHIDIDNLFPSSFSESKFCSTRLHISCRTFEQIFHLKFNFSWHGIIANLHEEVHHTPSSSSKPSYNDENASYLIALNNLKTFGPFLFCSRLLNYLITDELQQASNV
mmetsp:Transcript_10117/g.14079  ORF Transcript_10117/g.14079 Transcript_10117/m.14079 type:complete len:122 (+) Transcript_10117:702-1067(+)